MQMIPEKPILVSVEGWDLNIRTDEIATCTKIAYNSYREAQAVINYGKNHRRYVNGRRINRKVGRKDKRPVRSYRCPECGKWHLTSSPNEI
jgi:hypothetical protein